MTDRLFPIQDAEAIPWAVVAPCDRQCQRNHGGQTLERIAERGGLGAAEACDVLLGQPWDTTPVADAAGRLRQIVKERWYLAEVEQLRRHNESLASQIDKMDSHIPRWKGTGKGRIQVIEEMSTTIATHRKALDEIESYVRYLHNGKVLKKDERDYLLTIIHKKALVTKGEG